MKIEKKSSCLNIIVSTDIFYKLILIKLRNFKFLIPIIIKFIVDYQFSDWKINEVKTLV